LRRSGYTKADDVAASNSKGVSAMVLRRVMAPSVSRVSGALHSWVEIETCTGRELVTGTWALAVESAMKISMST
jgi:hypothetical protein